MSGFYQKYQLFLLPSSGLNELYRLALCLYWEETEAHILPCRGKVQPQECDLQERLKTKHQVNICSQEKAAALDILAFSSVNFVLNILLARDGFYPLFL